MNILFVIFVIVALISGCCHKKESIEYMPGDIMVELNETENEM